ncbi:VWA domain-containing protein [Nocardioides panaciterrulae]|uniref:VWA domain-containing protein n=1 Tax=Nocardioides panaciterrulae TaxID=661492 RepID=A0A7Y9JCU9_9ACTN|nr:VWA domain-containing protein [Nocardioides panaciterrulae]NYD43671.1 hypothetical protein [Nocardioides panaciterrulae]
MTERSGLVDRHVAFLRALREAGLAVSLAEGLDAVAALRALPWDDRVTLRDAYAATLVKRQAQRPTFDALFDVYFPRLVGEGAEAAAEPAGEPGGARDGADDLAAFRGELRATLTDGGQPALERLATQMVGRFGAMPGRGPGLSSWSAYQATRRVSPEELADQVVAALLAQGIAEEEAAGLAGRRLASYARMVEDDAQRRIAAEKGPDHVARVAVRPTIDRLDFLAARRTDLEAMRREIYPLARRLATRLTREQHARRRGPLDVRRTVRASVSTGGVPLVTHHRPRRPHRSELVVLCDVSGSVANFAQFTLLLVYALREQMQNLRAFTFVDDVHEVTDRLRPGADVADVMADLAASTAHASRFGRTSYGRAFTEFAQRFPDALGPKSSLLVLGDARSNYSDLAVPVLRELAGTARHAWWLNPEHPRHWGTGDSAARQYAEVVPMVECRNLAQLAEVVHDVL